MNPAPWRFSQLSALLDRRIGLSMIVDFVTDAECAHIIALAQADYERSHVVCDKPGGCVDTARTSSSASLPEDAVTTAIRERAMAYTGYRRCEPLQSVRYEPSQEYKPHLDAFDITTEAGRVSIRSSGGRRAATILVYLNVPQSGGATVFPELGQVVYPVKRAGLYWHNLLPDGSPNPLARHGGAPVRAGTKYALNVWLIEPEPRVV